MPAAVNSCVKGALAQSNCCIINMLECKWESMTGFSLVALQAELSSSEGLWKRCGWQDNSPDHISWRCNPENGAVWEGFPVCSGGIQMAGFQVAEIHCLQGESGKNTDSWNCEGHLIRNGVQTSDLPRLDLRRITWCVVLHLSEGFFYFHGTSALIKHVLQRHLCVTWPYITDEAFYSRLAYTMNNSFSCYLF